MHDRGNTRATAPERPPMLRHRGLAALKACALYPRGMRLAAFPQTMPVLARLGLVREGSARWQGALRGERAWFITAAGRRALAANGGGDDDA